MKHWPFPAPGGIWAIVLLPWLRGLKWADHNTTVCSGGRLKIITQLCEDLYYFWHAKVRNCLSKSERKRKKKKTVLKKKRKQFFSLSSPVDSFYREERHEQYMWLDKTIASPTCNVDWGRQGEKQKNHSMGKHEHGEMSWKHLSCAMNI